MKLVLLSLNFSPELTGIGKYSGEMAEWLSTNGHEVKVVCAPPYYPNWKVQKPYFGTRYQTEKTDSGISIYRCPVWVPSQPSGAKRLLHLFSFSLSIIPVMLRLCLWRPKLVIVVAPAFFSAPVGWIVARLSGAKAWLHIQDYEVDAAFELGLLRGSFKRRLILGVERWLMERFDKVSTISKRMVERLAAKKVSAKKIDLFPNWVDVRAIHPYDTPSPMRQQLNIRDDQIVCLYSGTINRKQGLGLLIDVAHKLTDHPEVVIIICGNGELRGTLEQATQGLNNVRFIDLQPAEKLNDLLNMADIHLLPQLSNAADLVMPSKLLGMLASGRPVLAAAHPGTEIASVVEGRGRVLEPENVAAFHETIIELSTKPEMRIELGAAARRYVEEYLERDAVLRAFDQRIAELVESKPGRVLIKEGAPLEG